MNVLQCLPSWGLRCLQHHRYCRQCQLQQRLTQLRCQQLVDRDREHWLIVFFEQELHQQSQSLKHINQELVRRTA